MIWLHNYWPESRSHVVTCKVIGWVTDHSGDSVGSLLTVVIKRPRTGAYLFSPQFPRRRRRIMVSLEYLPYY